MKKMMVSLLAGAMLMMATSAIAVPTPRPIDPPCSVSDMLLNGQNADACSGPISNPVVDSVSAINSLTGLFSGNAWALIAKTDGPTSGYLGGINFTISAQSNPNLWDLSWSGTALPASIDLVATLKGGDKWSAFLFQREMLAASGTNNPDDPWKITFFNNGGQIPGLSHISLYGRDVVPAEPNNPVPEPGTMMLLGMGMLGLAVYGKRRMNKEA